MKKFRLALALCLSTASAAFAASPSFDCAKASNTIEKLICSDDGLADLDVKLSQQYKSTLAQAADKASVKQRQIEWIKGVRSKCSDVACVSGDYTQRLAELAGSPQETSKPATVEGPVADQSPAESTASQPSGSQEAAPTITKTAATENSASPQPAVKPSAPQAATAASSNDKPAAGAISSLANFLHGLVVLVFVVGMINPAWVLRKSASPSRKALFLYTLVIGLPLSGLAEYSKSKEAKAFEANEKAMKQAEADARHKQSMENYANEVARKAAATSSPTSASEAFSNSDKKGYCNILATNLVLLGSDREVSDRRMSELIDENMDVMVQSADVENKKLLRKKMSAEMHNLLPSTRENLARTVEKFGDIQTGRILVQRCYKNQGVSS